MVTILLYTQVGRLKVVQKPVDWKRLKKVHSEVLRGGRNRPRDCKAKDKVNTPATSYHYELDFSSSSLLNLRLLS